MCFNKRIFTALLILMVCGIHSVAAADYRSDEILVKYKPGLHIMAMSSTAASVAGAKVSRTINQIRTQRIKLPAGISVEDAIARYKKDPNVEYVGPNHNIRICLEPNDEQYCFYDDWIFNEYIYGQWGLYSPDYPNSGIDAPEAWDINTGSSSIIIAIIDTGVYLEHEDLYEKIVQGRNCLEGAADPDDPNDDHGHGTAVASIAAAMTDNSIGVAGVSWGSMIMPVKVMDASGTGTEEDAAAGIVWAADHGANVLNLSLAGDVYSQAEYDAIEYAWNKGCVIVAASGNNNSSIPLYPASFEHALSVGATNESGQRCSPSDWGQDGDGNDQGSNYGSYLDVVAPGNNITCAGLPDELFGDYTVASGTSAAAPFVSGIAALILSQNPSWTNEQVVSQIKYTCKDINPTGWDQYTGWGLVSAYHALADAQVEYSKIGDIFGLSSGTSVHISDAVITSGSGELSDRICVEQGNRACGITLSYDNPPSGFSEGDIVKIDGTLNTVNGELAIQGASLTKTGTRVPLLSLGMPNAVLGGGTLGFKSGVTDGVGLNNLSLLVTVWGKVKSTGWTYFYIDDGSNCFDGSGFTGIKVISNTFTRPAIGSYVRVTGISSCEIPSGASVTIPVVRPRKQADILCL